MSVSADARLASKLQKAISDTPDVREGLVERLKAAINDGSYQVNPREIAEAMLKSRNRTEKTEGK